ncbi:LysR family transcriptional regulator [Amycolatopsis thermophila]|uniref:DNA-binding transcriptional LysR family regulator n=1 Tax=Amycolatopsis thermophila TaxID=206084 RepID=A0ABU0F2N9_9PSEU|nr:LysR family transcriptional regulator [Amycolatopsis thermophila]MDQ0381292.1 DNA-binding transcriptional LysR family regulator [Amycolatopsis thermophila]
MELRHLAAFVAVAEELHFGRAATRLHMAQSPLSRQIRLLERDLGLELFDRTTRTVTLTPEGQAFLEPARRTLAEADRARRAAAAARHGALGRVTVGFAGATGNALVPVLTRAVTSSLPGVELVLRGQTYSGTALDKVTDGTLDLSFVALPAPSDLATRVVRDERLLVALPDTHPLAGLDAVPLADLAAEPFVSFPSGGGSAVREAGLRACRDAGIAPRIVQEAPDAYTVLTLVGAEVGVAIMVESSRRIHTDHTVLRPIQGDVPVLPIALAWRPDNPSRALQAVLAVAEKALPTPDDADRVSIAARSVLDRS